MLSPVSPLQWGRQRGWEGCTRQNFFVLAFVCVINCSCVFLLAGPSQDVVQAPPHTHPIGGQGNTSCTLLYDHTLASHFWVVLWSMVLVTQCVCTWTNLHQKQQHLWSCVQYTLNFWNWTLKSSPEIQRHLLEQKSFNGFIPQESWCGTHLMRQPCLWEAKRSICSAR